VRQYDTGGSGSGEELRGGDRVSVTRSSTTIINISNPYDERRKYELWP